MRKKKSNKTLSLGTAIALSLAASPAIAATANPFQIQALKSGYLVSQADTSTSGDKSGKTPEAKVKDGKCGGAMGSETKPKDGKCGAMKSDDSKAKEAKCGEGTCGGNTKKKPM